MIVKYFLEADDDTYLYGDKMFECEFDGTSYIQPFVRREGKKLIKFYQDKHFFVVYEDGEITEIIRTMTCWSDDVIAYKIKNQVAYKFDEVYHGHPHVKDCECNIDFSEFIKEKGV
jgi:hypothetical protein